MTGTEMETETELNKQQESSHTNEQAKPILTGAGSAPTSTLRKRKLQRFLNQLQILAKLMCMM